jgi:hypothetical protein
MDADKIRPELELVPLQKKYDLKRLRGVRDAGEWCQGMVTTETK